MDNLASELLFNPSLCEFLEGGRWGALSQHNKPGLKLSFQSDSKGRN